MIFLKRIVLRIEKLMKHGFSDVTTFDRSRFWIFTNGFHDGAEWRVEDARD